MHKYAYQVLTALTLVAWLMVPATHAQSIMLKADIPFDFTVGDKQLHSGEYHVKQMNQGLTLIIESKDARSSAMVLTTPTQARKISDVGKLVFNRYGDQYFLSIRAVNCRSRAWSAKWRNVCRKVDQPL